MTKIVVVKDYGCPASRRYKAFRKGSPELAYTGKTAKQAKQLAVRGLRN
jgi:hypothetical protein